MNPKAADSIDFAAAMWISGVVHAWTLGLAWHFWLERLDLGPWFWMPLLLTIVPSLVVGAAVVMWIGEKIGLWSEPEPRDRGNVSG